VDVTEEDGRITRGVRPGYASNKRLGNRVRYGLTEMIYNVIFEIYFRFAIDSDARAHTWIDVF